MYNRFFKYLLDNEPTRVMSKRGIAVRKWARPIIQTLLPLFSKYRFHVASSASVPTDRLIIYAVTHGFRDEIVFNLLAIRKPAYFLFGSLPNMFYSFDGFLMWALGAILVDRTDKASRRAARQKMEYALDLGSNIMMYPEGVWNMVPNQVVQKLYPSIYYVAKEKNALIVPVTALLDGKLYHTVLGEPFDVSGYNCEEGLHFIRERMASVKWELMEQFAHAKRTDFAAWEPSMTYWTDYVESTIASAKGLYDPDVENNAQYRPKGEVPPQEAFSHLAQITPRPTTAFLFKKGNHC